MVATTQVLVVPGHCCGPPGAGNGGYVAGSLAGFLDAPGPVSVQLRQPTPLDATLQVRADAEGAALRFGGAVIAEAAPAEADPEPVEGVALEVAEQASRGFAGHASHPFPGCYACGTEAPEGLHVFPGPVDGDPDRLAAVWTPAAPEAADWHEYRDPTARAAAPCTWAALDCTSGWAAGQAAGEAKVLARMTCVVDELPVLGEPHVVVGERRATEGRKTTAASTLLDVDGRIVARAEALWISVEPGRFG